MANAELSPDGQSPTISSIEAMMEPKNFQYQDYRDFKAEKYREMQWQMWPLKTV
jgi:hypothetical protein